MFRRRRAVSSPHLNTHADPNAATAAAQAFLANRASNASLSSAAAAAALRSHTTSPVPVSEVQTRRNLQRQISAASSGSGGGSVRSAGGRVLSRQGSSSSMSERTFRDPSPARSSPLGSLRDAPPVPALPRDIPPIPAKSHRRTTSLEPPMRTIPSGPNRVSGRGTSVDRGVSGRGMSVDRGAAAIASITAAQRARGHGIVKNHDGDRPGSVNYSLPTTARSPPPRSPTGERPLIPSSVPQRPAQARVTASSTPRAQGDPGSVPPEAELGQSTNGPAPAKRKKKKKITLPDSLHDDDSIRGNSIENGQQRGGGDGHLSDSTQSGPNPSDSSSVTTLQDVSRPKKKKKKKAPVGPPGQDPSPSFTFLPSATHYSSDLDSIAESEDDRLPEPHTTAQPRGPGSLVKRPSIVREDREAEEQEERAQQATMSHAVPPTSQAKASNGGSGRRKGSSKASSAVSGTAEAAVQLVSGPDVHADHQMLGEGPSLQGRQQSRSPSRLTRFTSSPTPVQGLVKHEPPPRSLSPAKSALKQSPSPRGLSPAGPTPGSQMGIKSAYQDDQSEASFASEETPQGSEVLKKRRSVRVSFEDGPVLLGGTSNSTRSESPMSQSQPSIAPAKESNRKAWFGLGRGGASESRAAADASEPGSEEVLKPRPQLPFFGSVRARKAREDTETSSSTLADSRHADSPASSTLSSGSEHPGSSTDHALGSLIASDLKSKSVQSVSDDESQVPASVVSENSGPLPPEVTSVEGTGYVSDNDSDDDLPGSQNESIAPPQASTEPVEKATSISLNGSAIQSSLEAVVDAREGAAATSSEPLLPSIEVVDATPTVEQTDFRYSLDVPGKYPESMYSKEDDPASNSHAGDLSTVSPASVGIAEPELEETTANHRPGSFAAHGMDIKRPLTPDGDNVTDIDDDGSVYSDAAEDLSELEGDGFQSLDAVVESPIVDTFPGLAITTPPESPTPAIPLQRARDKSTPSKENGIAISQDQQGTDDWHKTQTYWSNLSEQRKEEIERQALSGDDQIETPATKPKKKKKRVPADTAASLVPSAVEERRGGTAVGTTQRSSGPSRTKKPQPSSTTPSNASANGSKLPSSLRTRLDEHVTHSPSNEGSFLSQATMKGTLKAGKKANKKSRPVAASVVTREPSSPAAAVNPISGARAGSDKSAAARPSKEKYGTRQSFQRTLSNGSDSDASVSSFRKERRRPASGEGFFMKKTLRVTSQPPGHPRSAAPARPGNQGRRFSLRSLSPASRLSADDSAAAGGSGFRRGTMRSSMRGSVDSGSPSLRMKAPDRARSPISFSGFRRFAKPAAAAPEPKSRFGSRFADSSDEGDARPTFRSRFSDSSDDGHSPAMDTYTPVRGIPRKTGEQEGDSTDLPDSSEGETPDRAPSTTVIPRTRPSNVRSSTSGLDLGRPGMGSVRDKDKKRRSFFGALGRRKDVAKVQKLDAESAARRDTPLERTKTELREAKESVAPTSPASNRIKLGKRWAGRETESPHWPLSPAVTNEQRPQTSDGVLLQKTLRPDLGDRRISTPAPMLNQPVVKLEKEKKKKFPRLRKVFGLHD